jgi:outer membrane protein insertion porin family
MTRLAAVVAAVAALVLAAPARADVADYIGRTVSSVRLVLEQHQVDDADLERIVATAVGAPLTMVDVRETVSRLFSLGRFEDIHVHAELDGAQVRLTYDLVPVHPVYKITFRGATSAPGVDTGRLRADVIERFGASPPIGRAPDVQRVVETDLHAEGYLHAAATPGAELEHAPDRAVLVFDLNPGARTRIADVAVAGTPGLSPAEILKLLDVHPGDPYRTDALGDRIAKYVENRRAAGYFAASITPSARFEDDDKIVHLTLTAVEGPRVRVVFRGDPLPPDRRAELVPIEREGSADEDLLEDSSNRIEDFLRGQGYRDAAAPHSREEKDGELDITFTVTKGPQYRVAKVDLSGNRALSAPELAPALHVKEGQPFSASRLDADVAAVTDLYRRQGFAAVRVSGDEEAAPREGSADVPVTVHIDISEGVRTVVGSVHVRGNASVPEADLVRGLGLQPGKPLFATQLAQDRDTLAEEYANRGFQSATVTSAPGLSADRTRADVVFTVQEGPKLVVDHILIVGNVRTKTETIQREVQFKPGDPLGQSAVNETQRRLASLGLFRRTEITAIGRGENQRDVLIRVDEAPVTTIGYGGGVEANEKYNGTGSTRLEFAPRAFFEVGRRNLFGKNRSINLFTRFAIRPKDSPIYTASAVQTQALAGTNGSYGFAEYRVLATFREPRVFGSSADAVVTGALEQQVRTSFDFARLSSGVEVGKRLSPTLSLSGNYQIQRVRLFNELIPPDQQLLVDRTFPQVRLSSFSTSVIRTTKNDPLDATEGTYLSANAQLAARAIASEVGFDKAYLRAQWFHELPHSSVVLATNATLGLAHAFERQVVQPDGSIVAEDDLPASERFFAGGDTTVRGFALDQLGVVSDDSRKATIDPATGLANGGNGLVVLNAELRVPYHKLQFVTFFDAGNVFAQPSDIDLAVLRSSVGFGVRYRSPVGPIRVDLGFKTHRHIVPGVQTLESATAIHISLGQAF